MANLNQPERFNPTFQPDKPEDLTNSVSRPIPKDAAVQRTAKHIADVDPENAYSFRKESDAPAKHVTYVTPEIIDRSEGLRIQTYGTALTDGISLADKGYRYHVTNQIDEAVAKANAEFTVDPASLVLPENEDGPPTEMKAQTDKMFMLTEAHKAGKMTDTNYYAKMSVLSRQLRNKYGVMGYGKWVDKTIKETMGFDAADALRKTLMAKAEAEAAKPSPMEIAFKSNLRTGNLPHDYWTNDGGTNPKYQGAKGMGLVNLYAQQKRNEKDSVEQDKLAHQMGEMEDKELYQTGILETNMYYSGLADKITSEQKQLMDLKGQGKVIEGRIQNQDPSDDLPTDPADLLRIQNSMKTLMVDHIHQKLATDYANLPPEMQQGLITHATTMAETMFVNVGSVDALNVAKIGSTAATETSAEVTLAGSPELRDMQMYTNLGLGDTFGALHPGFLESAIKENEKKVVVRQNILMATTGAPYNKMLERDTVTSATTKGIALDGLDRQFLDPRIDIKARLNIGRSLFSENFQENVRATQTSTEVDQGKSAPALQLYLKFARPEFAKAVMDTQDGQLQEDYTKYLLNQFKISSLGAINQVAQINPKRPNMTVTQDPNTGLFSLKYNAKAGFTDLTYNKDAGYYGSVERGVEQGIPGLWKGMESHSIDAVNQLNLSISAMTGAMKEMGYENRDALWLAMNVAGIANPVGKKDDALAVEFGNVIARTFQGWVSGQDEAWQKKWGIIPDTTTKKEE